MRKILEAGQVVCLDCGTDLDGVLINFQEERNELEPECELHNA